VAANLSDIEGQTDDIGAAGAGLTVLATQASVNTIDDFLDTEIAAILEDTGTTLPATLATIAAYIDTEIASLLTGVNVEQMNGNDVCGTGDAGTPWTGCP
jgi:hypothetical protein